MNANLPKLLQPFNLHELKLQNRVAMAPMTRARSGKDRIPNDLMVEYYRQRASAALILTDFHLRAGSRMGRVTRNLHRRNG